MAQQQHQDTPKIGFRSIQLLKTQTLGIGSYGSVCKALCDDLLCAAKIIHPTLFDPNAHQRVERQREHRLPISRFMQECEFMSAIRHPNIVQYLGTHQDPETRLPVLLMELMDGNLTQFLESSQTPYHIQVNFCNDITLATSYLHSNGMVHRDLSSNNVLLRGNVQAKVTDFGMAKLGDINPRATHVSFTMCPGTDVYMPPEAVKDKPVYTAKIDCFAIGTLIIQILTRYFPDPGERLKRVQTTDPRFPTVSVQVPELERRQNHISQVDPNHPLLPIALDCLKDSDIDRPSAQELCHRVAALKETPQFTESVRKAQESHQPGDTTEREEELRDLRQQIHYKDDIIQQKDDIIQQKDDENRQMRQEHVQQIRGLQQIIGTQNNRLQAKDDIIREKNDIIRQNNDIVAERNDIIQQNGNIIQERNDIIKQRDDAIQEKDQQIKEKERHLQEVTQQLECNEHITAQFQTRIQELEQQLKRQSPTEVLAKPQPSLTDPPQTHHTNTTSTRAAMATSDSFTLKWREARKPQRKINRGPDAIVDGNMVYFTAGNNQTIYLYSSTDETWSQIPEHGTKYFSLAIVNNMLTTIGGEDRHGKKINKLISLTREGRIIRSWREVFQPMPTKRSLSAAVSTHSAKDLIVAGGVDSEGKRLRTVEVMNTETQGWSSAENLPEKLSNASATICHDRIYIIGGYSDSGDTMSVYTCTLTDLFQSCRTRSLGKRIARSLSLNSPGVWNRVACLPVGHSTCVTLQGRLLAIGGYDSKDTPTSDVHMYHPTSDTWEVISKMKISRWLCFAAVLPTNQVIVVGGRTGIGALSYTDSVEVATIN